MLNVFQLVMDWGELAFCLFLVNNLGPDNILELFDEVYNSCSEKYLNLHKLYVAIVWISIQLRN